MTKLEDIALKTKDRALKEHVSDVVTLWNGGKFSFTVSGTSSPTDTPSDGELRVWHSGAGVGKLLVFIPGSVTGGGSSIGWWTLALTTIG